jgi:Fe-Mn family superoxide dismutase
MKRPWYELPELNYEYDALEPHIDAMTMQIHYSKHHRGYVDGANDALYQLEKARESGDYSSIRRWERDLSFNLSGHINHKLFWESIGPDGGGSPEGEMRGKVKRDFGSLDAFKAHLTAAALSIQGSGWVILSWDPIAKLLLLVTAENHENRGVRGGVPLMALDMWEHAFYLKYQYRKADYVSAYWNVVDWKSVARRFEKASGG